MSPTFAWLPFSLCLPPVASASTSRTTSRHCRVSLRCAVLAFRETRTTKFEVFFVIDPVAIENGDDSDKKDELLQ
jgi:hypothetical protein